MNSKNVTLCNSVVMVVCMACGCGPKSGSTEGRGQKVLDICREPWVVIEVGPEDHLFLEDLQRKALVRLKGDFGFAYSNTWTLGVVVRGQVSSNAPVCGMKYFLRKGAPEYLVEFNRQGEIVECQRVVANSAVSLDEVYPDNVGQRGKTNSPGTGSDK